MPDARAVAFALAAMVGACGQPNTSLQPQSQSELARQISDDLVRLDDELAVDGVVAVGIGESADLGGGLTVTPIVVVEDSRCPANVACSVAGRFVLRASVSGTQMDLEPGRWIETANGWLLLAVVKPRRWANWPEGEIPPPPYRFGFRRA